MQIPIYITNKNRLTSLRRLVNRLLNLPDAGKITILDQGSTYQPLLDFYKDRQKDITVVQLAPNPNLCWVFWALNMQEHQSGPYIVTDGDYTFAPTCPRDVILRMVDMLQRYYDKGFFKVGPGIRTDNLPDSPWRDEAIESQKQYTATLLPHEEAFSSAIDTSFAVYKRDFGGQGIGNAIRLDAPYLLEHYPWYIWPLDDEERYYIAHDEYSMGHTSNLKRKGLV